MKKEIKSMQDDEKYIVLNNPLRNPKFIRKIGKGKESIINETYTPKIFYEIVSRLKPEHLEGIKRNESIFFDLQIKDFLEEIGANGKNFKHLIQSVEALQSTILKWKDGDNVTSVPIISKSIHNEKTGKIELFIDSDLARRILEVKDKENFSFLKSNVFRLQNAQAIRLYPFFKSWLNYCYNEETGKKQSYDDDLQRFKVRFGYDSKGYERFGNFRKYVLDPAKEEINEKTDININYETVGENLDGKRPRVTGLKFWIYPKDKVKKLDTGERHEEQNKTPKQVVKEGEPKERPQKKQYMADTPSEFDINQLGEKIRLNPQQIQSIISKLDGNNIRVWEVLQGCINESKTNNIKSAFAYIINPSSLNTLGLGLWQNKKDQAIKYQVQQEEKEKRNLLENIQTEYKQRKYKQFSTIYSNATEENKNRVYEFIKETFVIESLGIKRNYYLKGNELNEGGISKAGEILADEKGIGKDHRQNKFRNEVFEKYKIQIGFDEKDEVVFL
jgi:hypothetical protein